MNEVLWPQLNTWDRRSANCPAPGTVKELTNTMRYEYRDVLPSSSRYSRDTTFALKQLAVLAVSLEDFEPGHEACLYALYQLRRETWQPTRQRPGVFTETYRGLLVA